MEGRSLLRDGQASFRGRQALRSPERSLRWGDFRRRRASWKIGTAERSLRSIVGNSARAADGAGWRRHVCVRLQGAVSAVRLA